MRGKGEERRGRRRLKSLLCLSAVHSVVLVCIRMHVRKDGLLGEEEDSFLSSFPPPLTHTEGVGGGRVYFPLLTPPSPPIIVAALSLPPYPIPIFAERGRKRGKKKRSYIRLFF